MRIARKFDTNPASKALIFRPSSIKSDYTSAATMHYSHILNGFLSNGKFYLPSKSGVSLQSVLKSEFAMYHSTISISDRIDAAFTTLKKLSSIWSRYELENAIFKHSNWNIKPNFNVEIAKNLEPGVILCAHPMIYGTKHRSLVLILECTKERVYGLVINKYGGDTLEMGTKGLPQHIADTFAKNNLFRGGDMRRMQYLHTYEGCNGIRLPYSEQPLFGGGNIAKAIAKAKDDEHMLENVQIYAGCCLWTRADLDQELADGYWLPVIAPADRIIKYTLNEYHSKISNSQIKNVTQDNVSDANISNPKVFTGEAKDKDKAKEDDFNSSWSLVMKSLNENESCFATLPTALNVSNVEPASWSYSNERPATSNSE